MKIELCMFFQWVQDVPRPWEKLIKTDGRTFSFVSHKCERSFTMKRNPRKINWTVLYRRKHKKGILEEEVKRRTHRTQRYQRAIVGSTLTDILAKRNEKPEFRKAQREEAIRALKEKTKLKAEQKKAAEQQKKAAANKNQKKQQQQKRDKVAKTVQAKAPRVGGKR